MAYQRCQLVDAAPGGLGAYVWEANYDTEDEFSRARSYQRTATTDGVGVVRQQGDDGPVILKVSGVALRRVQHEKFVAFFLAARDRTMHFIDFEGYDYEVFITAYNPTRVRTSRNPQDPSMMFHYIKYSLQFEAVNVLSGPWAGMFT